MAILKRLKLKFFYGTAPIIECKINNWLSDIDCEIVKMNYLNDDGHTGNILCFILYREL